jgi:uncharacterized protein
MLTIPYQQLSADALQGLMESFVLREGTDYGAQELSLAEKLARLKQQLDSGRAVIVYDEVLESVTILPASELKNLPES